MSGESGMVEEGSEGNLGDPGSAPQMAAKSQWNRDGLGQISVLKFQNRKALDLPVFLQMT